MINVDAIKEDKVLCTIPVAIWCMGAYSIHEISIMEPATPDTREYLIFDYISGTSISNWTKDEYDKANQYFDIGNREIVSRSLGSPSINVPNKYRL